VRGIVIGKLRWRDFPVNISFRKRLIARIAPLPSDQIVVVVVVMLLCHDDDGDARTDCFDRCCYCGVYDTMLHLLLV
jgi:hypothetical protein